MGPQPEISFSASCNYYNTRCVCLSSFCVKYCTDNIMVIMHMYNYQRSWFICVTMKPHTFNDRQEIRTLALNTAWLVIRLGKRQAGSDNRKFCQILQHSLQTNNSTYSVVMNHLLCGIKLVVFKLWADTSFRKLLVHGRPS